MNSQSAGKIAVLGAGAWGSTMAVMLAKDPSKSVRLWAHSQEQAEKIKRTAVIDKPSPIPLPESLPVSHDLEATIYDADIIVLACTSQSLRDLSKQAVAILKRRVSEVVIVSVVKGLELKTYKRMSEVIKEEIASARVISLSGPNLAIEIRAGAPAAAVVAGESLADARLVQKALSTKKFRLYASDDVVGVELGGTLKNVIAIAAGGSDGLNLGINAKSALLTRGLTEMKRLAVSLGARESTLYGLSGMGDLFATCQGDLSRNYRVGFYLARGATLEHTLKRVDAVAEGVNTTFAVCDLARGRQLELPIAEQVELILKDQSTPEQAIGSLMGRPLATE